MKTEVQKQCCFETKLRVTRKRNRSGLKSQSDTVSLVDTCRQRPTSTSHLRGSSDYHVEALYRNILEQSPEKSGLTTWYVAAWKQNYKNFAHLSPRCAVSW
ncbi:hypothetical protein HPB49_022604 [Dermacentor silvarum]|uniref:Uncharacterized protein n=1 Tax=Dermacentor silvarum TaxID=543639 RepID=A0ACB8DRK5_DERSI|nr:hypothetical protein HPB49_022604 [Dermacentor silvarum]